MVITVSVTPVSPRLRACIAEMERDEAARRATQWEHCKAWVAHPRNGFDVAAQDLDGFVDYCMGFYGPGGVFERLMDHVVTVDLVREATMQLLRMKCNDSEEPPFEADSIDRESVRSIINHDGWVPDEYRLSIHNPVQLRSD